MQVPRQIIQFWDAEDRIPERIRAAMQTWMDRPGYSYRRFNEAQARQFLQENLPAAVAQAYEQAAHPVLKADLFRYAALSVLGGVYIDADDICLRFPQEIIAGCPGLTLVRKFNDVVSNNFIVCVPGHPVLRKVMDQTVANILQRVSNNIWEVSGPLLVDRLVRSADPAGIDILSFEEFRNWIGSSKPEASHLQHWSDFQRRHSIFTDPIDPEAPGLFDLIEKIPVPEGAERTRFLADGLNRRNRINRILEAAGHHLVRLERMAIIEDHDLAISRWFYPYQLTLQITCVFERLDGLRVWPPLNFELQDYRGFARKDASAAGLDLIVVPDPTQAGIAAATGLPAEHLHAALRPGGMLVALGDLAAQAGLNQALIDAGMHLAHQSVDGAVYTREMTRPDEN
ncbi:MAG: glycosyltransferase [Sinimarinibacterium sp.]|jgi:hypothetical protein